MRPSQEDIDTALEVERNITPEEKALYLECVNGKLMSERFTDQELRDGCVLVNYVFQVCRPKTEVQKSKQKTKPRKIHDTKNLP